MTTMNIMTTKKITETRNTANIHFPIDQELLDEFQMAVSIEEGNSWHWKRVLREYMQEYVDRVFDLGNG